MNSAIWKYLPAFYKYASYRENRNKIAASQIEKIDLIYFHEHFRFEENQKIPRYFYLQNVYVQETTVLFSCPVPARQRQLFNSSSGSVFQNNLSTTHGSQSSEDNTQDGGNVREPSVEKHFFSIIHKTDEGDEDEEDDSDLISLNQFLTESNRSPASRVSSLCTHPLYHMTWGGGVDWASHHTAVVT